VPTPARWRARQASPASIRLVGEKTTLVVVDVALSRNAIMNKTAATKPSNAVSFFRSAVHKINKWAIVAAERNFQNAARHRVPPGAERNFICYRGPGQLQIA
jgi:hypothetical protein